MRGDRLSVYLKNHLNLFDAFSSGHLAMSSLFAVRSFPILQKLGDEAQAAFPAGCAFALQAPSPSAKTNLFLMMRR